MSEVAVIGLACRFPGAPDAAAFWQNLRGGVVPIRSTPSDRWYWANCPGPDDTSPRLGGYIDDVDRFDARFFGITPREAEWMDPQHRIMLELSWSCLEDAGYAPSALSGKSVGVYVGVSNADYRDLALTAQRYDEPHAPLGLATSILTNRISNYYNWSGPSLPVDTACSSSLVALHQALRDLERGDSTLAMVGGVNLCLRPALFNSFARAGMLSPDGLCRTFDARARGYTRGEGAGAVLLKPLARAVEDGDRVYGVIRGSAINHGGAAVTLTSPNAFAQSSVIVKAFRDAGIGPDRVSYIEAHGTGTALGDPIEVLGLKRAFLRLGRELGVDTARTRVLLGAVKTQIGHLEPAAGIAGLVKVLLSLTHSEVPGLEGFETLNPKIDLDGTPFRISRETTSWPRGGRVAGLSSFGFGGVNAHAVIADAPPAAVESAPERRAHLLVLSAHDETRLRARAQALLAFVAGPPSPTEPPPSSAAGFASLIYTLQVGREAMPERLACVVRSSDDLVTALRSFVSRDPPPESAPWTTARVAPARRGTGGAKKGRPASLEDAHTRWLAGEPLDFETLHEGAPRPRRIGLPTYPFDDQRYWVSARPKEAAGAFRLPARTPDDDVAVSALLAEHEVLERTTRPRVAAGLFRALAALGLDVPRARTHARAELGVGAKYERLFDGVLRLAESIGIVRGEASIALVADAPPAPDAPTLPHEQLLQACLDALAPVLRGEVAATAVLFPNGSLDLVERVYSGNTIADFFNLRAAQAVEAAVRARLTAAPAGTKVHVLEIGAGTGSTSRFVFELLRPLADRVTYAYTDRSRGFFTRAARLIADAPYVQLDVLDIEADLDGQPHIPLAYYDVVLASNVLHATRDIRRVLRHVAALAKEKSVLVLNELATVSPFTTLTFGLLDGWWLFDDPDLRMPGSPGLSFEQWSRVLAETGFSAAEGSLDPRTAALGQQVLTALCAATSSAPRANVLEAPRPSQSPPATEETGLPLDLDTSSVEDVEDLLVGVLSTILRMSRAEIRPAMHLSEIGVDSLVALELQSSIESRLRVEIPITFYLDDLTISEAATRILAMHATTSPRSAGGDEDEGYV